jgi:hypothetical protein
VADVLVTNFCRLGVPRELRSDQCWNFGWLLQEVWQCLGLRKARITPLHPQTVWWNDTWRQLRSTWERYFQHTKESGTRGCLSSWLHTEQQPTRPQTWHDARQHGVREKDTSALRPAVRGYSGGTSSVATLVTGAAECVTRGLLVVSSSFGWCVEESGSFGNCLGRAGPINSELFAFDQCSR